MSMRPTGHEMNLEIMPDTGCQYSPSCLACPLPVCKYDNPGLEIHLARGQSWVRVEKLKAKDREIMDALGQGVTHVVAAKMFGVTARTIARVSARNR